MEHSSIITPASLAELERLAGLQLGNDLVPSMMLDGSDSPPLGGCLVGTADSEQARAFLVAAASAIPGLLAYIRALENVRRQARACLNSAYKRAARRADGQEYAEWVFDGLQHELLRLELDSLQAAGYGEGNEGA
ncbi:MAG TPA: hypothetical protein VIJ28_09575 [Chloroflexota bacterium]|jgi:hypothetical protein